MSSGTRHPRLVRRHVMLSTSFVDQGPGARTLVSSLTAAYRLLSEISDEQLFFNKQFLADCYGE